MGAGVVACLSHNTTQTSIETDNPTTPAVFVGTVTATVSGADLVITATNLQSPTPCLTAQVGPATNVANYFLIVVHVPAVSSSGAIMPATYENVTASLFTTNATCSGRTPLATGLASVQLNAYDGEIDGSAKIQTVGTTTIVLFQGAPVCDGTKNVARTKTRNNEIAVRVFICYLLFM